MYKKEKLEELFDEFCIFLEYKSGKSFISFREHPYIDAHENYKYEVRKIARDKLNFIEWDKNRCGDGSIVDAIIKSIEIEDNNFVNWHDKYGPDTKEHKQIYSIKENALRMKKFEKYTYDYFYDLIDDEQYFNYLLIELGKKYRLIAYLFFIKNSDLYLPIAPMYFDKLFIDLEVDLKTSKKCSWDNYKEYLYLITKIKEDIENIIKIDITLIDAHSFCWIVTSQMRDEKEKYNWSSAGYDKDVLSKIKSRRGQGRYRDGLLRKWNNSSSFGENVKNCFLISSHIKPWRDCNYIEAIDIDNGLLLTPNYDLLFDSGYISFDSKGDIIISGIIGEHELKILGIDKNAKLLEINQKMKEYLEFHRRNVYKNIKHSNSS